MEIEITVSNFRDFLSRTLETTYMPIRISVEINRNVNIYKKLVFNSAPEAWWIIAGYNPSSFRIIPDPVPED